MRRFFFNNSHFIDQAFYAFIGLVMTMAFADTISGMSFEHIPIEQQAFTKISIMLCFFCNDFFCDALYS